MRTVKNFIFIWTSALLYFKSNGNQSSCRDKEVSKSAENLSNLTHKCQNRTIKIWNLVMNCRVTIWRALPLIKPTMRNTKLKKCKPDGTNFKTAYKSTIFYFMASEKKILPVQESTFHENLFGRLQKVSNFQLFHPPLCNVVLSHSVGIES